jgi:hypothetical protein
MPYGEFGAAVNTLSVPSAARERMLPPLVLLTRWRSRRTWYSTLSGPL